jgi:hypothetical protein
VAPLKLRRYADGGQKRNSQFSEEIVYNSKISSFATNLFAR